MIPTSRKPRWLFALSIATAMVAVLAAAGGCDRHADIAAAGPDAAATESPVPPPHPTGKTASSARTVELVIDYGDGAEKRFGRIPWHEGLTALDALAAAKNRPHGVTFVARGSGPTAFVTQVDDLQNQGGEANSKNWTFHINDRLVDKSCGLADVRPGDIILWKFGASE
jgi:hypothetical protein